MNGVTLDEMKQLLGEKELELFAFGREVRRLMQENAELKQKLDEATAKTPEGKVA